MAVHQTPLDMSPLQDANKASEIAETIKKLSIDTTPPKAATKSKALEESDASNVADSWEDEADEGDAPPSRSAAGASSLSRPRTSDLPDPPPPTPASPSVYKADDHYSYSIDGVIGGSQRSASPATDPDKRPEKSTAVASRLIAGALGVRAPRRTEEQRKYDRAVKEQEIKRKNREKEELRRKEEEAQKAKAAMWDD